MISKKKNHAQAAEVGRNSNGIVSEVQALAIFLAVLVGAVNKLVWQWLHPLLRSFRRSWAFVSVLATPLILRRRWYIAFVINAGSQADLDAHCPKSLQSIGRDLIISFGGFMLIPGHGVSIILATPFLNKEFTTQPKIVEGFLNQLAKLRVKRIALNGVIPSAVQKHGVEVPDERFVLRNSGTIFMVTSNVRDALGRQEHSDLRGKAVAVVGAGYTGTQVAARLTQLDHQVLIFDTREDTKKRVDQMAPQARFCGSRFWEIEKAGVIVLLTSRGDDGISSILPHLQCGQVVISDTHPKVSRTMWENVRDRGVTAYESATTVPGFRIVPKMRGWPQDTLPGCLVQAFVEATAGVTDVSQEEFEKHAELAGVVTRLDTPPM